MNSSNHATVFKRLLATRRQELLEALFNAACADTSKRQLEAGQVQLLAGQILGLEDAIKLSDNADFEINGG